MSSIPVPDEQTHYSFRRQDDVDALAWPVFSQRALDLLRSAGEVLHPEPGELVWDTRDTYDLYLVLADVPTVALEFHHGGNTAQRQPEDGPRCHRYDASITSASPSRTSTP